MHIRSTAVVLSAALLGLTLGSGAAWAQATAQISGTVRDQDGGVLPGVDVTVLHAETGLTRTTVTNAAGGVPSRSDCEEHAQKLVRKANNGGQGQVERGLYSRIRLVPFLLSGKINPFAATSPGANILRQIQAANISSEAVWTT